MKPYVICKPPSPLFCVPLFATAVVLPKAEKLLKVSIQPYISSILDALMESTSQGFSEVRDLFFRELVDMSKNTLNEGTKETVAQVRRQRRLLRMSSFLWAESLLWQFFCTNKHLSCPSLFLSTWRRSLCWPSIR